MSNLHHLLASICDSQYEKQRRNDTWIESLYKKVNDLKLDYVGKVGELFVKQICDSTGIPFVYDEDKNTSSDNDTFDMLICDKRVEIKTAREGKSKTFQHENLRNKECDYYMFVDIAPKEIYLTILPSFDMRENCILSGRKPHLRKGASNIYKFDFTPKTIRTFIEKDVCLVIEENTTTDEMSLFICDKLLQDERSTQIVC